MTKWRKKKPQKSQQSYTHVLCVVLHCAATVLRPDDVYWRGNRELNVSAGQWGNRTLARYGARVRPKGVVTNPFCKEIARLTALKFNAWLCSSPWKGSQLYVTIGLFFLFYPLCPHKCKLLEIHSDWWIDFQLATLGLSSWGKPRGPSPFCALSRALRAQYHMCPHKAAANQIEGTVRVEINVSVYFLHFQLI